MGAEKAGRLSPGLECEAFRRAGGLVPESSRPYDNCAAAAAQIQQKRIQ